MGARSAFRGQPGPLEADPPPETPPGTPPAPPPDPVPVPSSPPSLKRGDTFPAPPAADPFWGIQEPAGVITGANAEPAPTGYLYDLNLPTLGAVNPFGSLASTYSEPSSRGPRDVWGSQKNSVPLLSRADCTKSGLLHSFSCVSHDRSLHSVSETKRPADRATAQHRAQRTDHDTREGVHHCGQLNARPNTRKTAKHGLATGATLHPYIMRLNTEGNWSQKKHVLLQILVRGHSPNSSSLIKSGSIARIHGRNMSRKISAASLTRQLADLHL